jgi:hypothetical protein
MPSFTVMTRAFVAAALIAAAGCSSEPTPAEANAPMHCDRQLERRSMCAEYIEPRSPLYRESIFAQCREGGGKLVDECPTENLVGVCEQPQDERRANTMARTVRVYHYLEPDLATDDEIAAIADRCSGDNTWTDAADLEADG